MLASLANVWKKDPFNYNRKKNKNNCTCLPLGCGMASQLKPDALSLQLWGGRRGCQRDHRQHLHRWMSDSSMRRCRPGGLLWHPYGWLCLPFQSPITRRRSDHIELSAAVSGHSAVSLAKGSQRNLERTKTGNVRIRRRGPGFDSRASNIKI